MKLGVVLLFVVFSLNAIYAYNDYGITKNKLHNEILAQSIGSGGLDCRCAASLVGWGEGCKADNWGAKCVDGSQTCWAFDGNCKGGSSAAN